MCSYLKVYQNIEKIEDDEKKLLENMKMKKHTWKNYKKGNIFFFLKFALYITIIYNLDYYFGFEVENVRLIRYEEINVNK